MSLISRLDAEHNSHSFRLKVFFKQTVKFMLLTQV